MTLLSGVSLSGEANAAAFLPTNCFAAFKIFSDKYFKKFQSIILYTPAYNFHKGVELHAGTME